ncbi:MAG: DUF3108 domain-containing protein [Acetobacter sp.]|nr:DUF3108 domain-containing protein [Acetobacter sp.]
MLSRIFFYRSITVALVVLVSAFGKVRADDVLSQTVARYTVYMHGLRAMYLDVTYSDSHLRYIAAVQGKTVGLIGLFLSGNLSMHAEGNITDRGFVKPETFTFSDDFHHREQQLQMIYKKDVPVVVKENPQDIGREVVTPQERTGAVDMLAALIEVLEQVKITHRCAEINGLLFDGRRLSTLQVHAPQQNMPLSVDVLNVPGKETLRCDFVLHQIRGFMPSEPGKPSKLHQLQPGYIWFQNIPTMGIVVSRLELQHPKMGRIVLVLRKYHHKH